MSSRVGGLCALAFTLAVAMPASVAPPGGSAQAATATGLGGPGRADLEAAFVAYVDPVPGEPVVLRGFDPPDQPWLAGHRGVDLAADVGDPITAAADGVVAFAGVVAGTPVVSIDHADGLRTTYQPVTAVVEAGAPVTGGEHLGDLGEGDHCGPDPCLHWGARTGPKSYVDPLALLRPPVVRLYPLE